MQGNEITCTIRDSENSEHLVVCPLDGSKPHLTSLVSSLLQAQEQINQELTKLVEVEKAAENSKSAEANEKIVSEEEPEAKRLKNSC